VIVAGGITFSAQDVDGDVQQTGDAAFSMTAYNGSLGGPSYHAEMAVRAVLKRADGSLQTGVTWGFEEVSHTGSIYNYTEVSWLTTGMIYFLIEPRASTLVSQGTLTYKATASLSGAEAASALFTVSGRIMNGG
jgi:hypothetical protein